MKVLFAVNNDNVSEAIATKYQKEYKEILSYKNVYYFNAIIRELQKDKSYNRIVISEDLEPFANNNYDMIDKFLLNKYSNISQEAKTLNEERIEIILLGADRRRKSEDLLIKLFGLEIYNIILGQDRSIEEVCRLIYSPREKNEARIYYNIPVNELGSQDDSENNVSEAEVENILAHYKRLGRNEEKYVDSFNNIIAQYTDTQLKIIIKYLPIHVKAVLEEKSAKYQQLVTSGLNGGNMKFDLKTNKYKQKTQKKSFWKSNKSENYDAEEEFDDSPLIDRDFAKPKMTKPIVIPSDMNTENAQRISGPRTTIGRQDGIRANEMEDFQIEKTQIEQKQPDGTMNFEQEQNIRKQEMQYNQISNNIGQKQTTMNLNYELNEEKQINQTQSYQNNQIQQNNVNSLGQNLMNDEQNKISRTTNVNEISRPEIPQIEPKTVQQPEIEKITPIQEIEKTVVKQGIQENAEIEASKNPFEDLEQITTSEQNNIVSNVNNISQTSEQQPVKRGRGRPRKKPIVEVDPNKPKRGRGRPRKEASQVEHQETTVTKPIQDEIIHEVQPINQEQDNDLFSMSEEIEKKSIMRDFPNTLNNEFDLFNMNEGLEATERKNANMENDTNLNSNTSNYAENHIETNNVDLFNMEETTPIQKIDNMNRTNDKEENYNSLNQFDVQQNSNTETPTQETDLFNIGNIEENNINSDLRNNSNFENEGPTPPYRREEVSQYNESSEVDLFNINTPPPYEENEIMTTERVKTISNLNNLLTSDKKIVAFVGTTKNGTSFVVNNTAEMLASMGISTAVLDMTRSKNSYYIYTNNEEELRNVATKCMKNLENGIPEGLKINRSLSIYTEMPGEEGEYNIDSVLATLIQNYSAILIDTDFETPIEIFERVQEIYLVQTLDVLTIQPLTAFLRNLKSKNILQQDKLKIVINKSQKMRSLNVRTLIGGMSCYNAPNMSYMTELFDKDNVKYCEIPFETQNYVKYLESLVNCSISLNGYTKTLLASLKELANIVYPLVGKQSYSPMNNNHKDPFSKQMSSTLSKMRNKGY